MAGTVIVGAGVAGVQTALDLRHRGYTGEVTLVSDEQEEPYDRPPLSKDYLKGTSGREGLRLLSVAGAEKEGIHLLLGQAVTDIRTDARQVVLADGSTVDYDDLVLAVGAANRALRAPGIDLPGVWGLRRLADADGLRAALARARDVVIVGGGFIGLEVAAAARAGGAHVTVVEFLPRVMARVLSPEMSQHFAQLHQGQGVDIRTGLGVTGVVAGPDGAAGVTLSDDSQVPADVVVVGVGVIPVTELAVRAGIDAEDGVLVDEQLRTSVPHVYAIGDCARFFSAHSGRQLRLESIQNAADQARFVADRIAAGAAAGGDVTADAAAVEPAYGALPWFWSEQFSAKLQIAGVSPAEADAVVRGDAASGSFSVCRFVDDRLVAVESVNSPRDHLAARKILAQPGHHHPRVTREAVADPQVPLKSLLDA